MKRMIFSSILYYLFAAKKKGKVRDNIDRHCKFGQRRFLWTPVKILSFHMYPSVFVLKKCVFITSIKNKNMRRSLDTSISSFACIDCIHVFFLIFSLLIKFMNCFYRLNQKMASEKDRFALPDWIGRPPRGSHLDVLKTNKLIQKLIVDEKGHYYFGRNPSDCDFVCEHASCSRVHAVLLFHKKLKRFAMVDLESSHGTFVDNVRIQPLSPVFLDPNQCFHFGASTRKYYLGEKATTSNDDMDDEEREMESGVSQTDLDNQTELNTANNRRIATIAQTLEDARRKLRLRPKVKFNDEEEIINPEELDPTVGRFRNMVRTAVIPVSSTHRRKIDKEDQLFDFYAPSHPKKKKFSSSTSFTASNGAVRPSSADRFTSVTLGSLSLNAAPDLDLYSPGLPPPKTVPSATPSKYGPSLPRPSRQLLGVSGSAGSIPDSGECPSKKKYAKEAWPADMRRRSGVL